MKTSLQPVCLTYFPPTDRRTDCFVWRPTVAAGRQVRVAGRALAAVTKFDGSVFPGHRAPLLSTDRELRQAAVGADTVFVSFLSANHKRSGRRKI